MEKREPSYTTGAATKENSMEVPSKTKKIYIWSYNYTPEYMSRKNS